MDRIMINAVVFQQDGFWVAQCLEYNLVSFSEELEELPGELMRQIRAHVEFDLESGRTPFADFGKAPAKYWKMFERATQDPRLPEPPSLPQVEAHLVLAA